MWKGVTAIAAVFVITAGLVYRAELTAQFRRIQAETIPAPANWVAFEADLTETSPSESPIVGRYLRASDGSFRLESRPADRSVVVIGIYNLTHRMSYNFNRGVWFSIPLAANLANPGVPKVRADRPGMVRWNEPIQGFQVYRSVHARGDTVFEAPALNFYPIVYEWPNGKRRELSNIRLVEPSRDLFEPPPGVRVIPLKSWKEVNTLPRD